MEEMSLAELDALWERKETRIKAGDFRPREGTARFARLEAALGYRGKPARNNAQEGKTMNKTELIAAAAEKSSLVQERIRRAL